MKKHTTILTLFVLLSIFFVSTKSFSQNAKKPLDYVAISKEAQKPTNPELKDAPEGTFQFVIRDTKMEYVFTTDLLKVIESNRDKKEIKYIQVAPTVDVKILPQEYIDSPNFKPLPLNLYVN